MAYGTQSVRAVDRITGPGSSYVAAAKLAAAGRVGIDMLAGPTEIVILADESAHPDWVAADLIAQAEHDPQAWPILVTHAPGLAAAVNTSLNHLLNGLRTQETASAALREQGFIYQASNPAECLEVVNRIAPEHLALHVTAVDAILKRVRAGAVFIGGQTPVAWGDYWAGPNHTLPTMGHARFRGPLSVLDFLVPYAVIMAGRRALRESGPVVRILAEQEGLAGHALSVALRDGSYG
jgi:histidinol dehydrogenase